ncbi:response regulator transcription factor [Paenibacillus sp. FSL M7-1455]|jgi:NarL family two-component system response regulator LiaR|uniref:DNA-binding response regulator n=1 Tax=Paenibacillus cookii TaxID=157839 RepID=A0ABQ4LXY2_9BACL|nr:response regulator transcription factor [Paenibacillus cookii]KHF31614.1 Transcriptional regulatory protein LiaR [Paenibacillus sp. P1XP2]GIO68135.1 DNA-binding response regulator [Paenibacillus cookii]HWO53171.1 response regulator transcription factor [Paenibacillus cookii]
MTDVLKVMIVDDHEMVRMGLKTYLMLEPSIEVVGEADNGSKVVDWLKNAAPEQFPDLILMDLMMPVMNGVETTRAVLAEFPAMKIVILTSFLEDELVVDAVEAGAVSYVLKTVSADELIYALQGANRGMPVMTGDVSQALTRGIRQRTVQGDSSGLTEREKEVLLLIAEGKSNKEIAEELHISIKTVKTHVSNLLMKCELEDRTQLAIYAHRKGWVQGS